MSETNTIK